MDPCQGPLHVVRLGPASHTRWGVAAQVSGMFWNYMSIGADAAAAHGFHQLRESKPWAARGRYTNQSWCVGDGQ
jgi:Diacylglycerol kinase accessory domain